MNKGDRRLLKPPTGWSPAFKQYLLKLCRISSLGYASSGVMHEMGNAMTVISGNAQIIQFKINDMTAEQTLERMDVILGQIARMLEAIENTGSMSIRVSGEPLTFDPAMALTAALYAFSRRCNLAQIEVAKPEPAANPAPIYADRYLLEYILFEAFDFFLWEDWTEASIHLAVSYDRPDWTLTTEIRSSQSAAVIDSLFERSDVEELLSGCLTGLESMNGGLELFRKPDVLGWNLRIPLKAI